MKKIGILTSGGDCPGLNAAIRGVAKAAYGMFPCEIVGILDGFKGLMEGRTVDMSGSDFSGILTRGGTILGTARTPYKRMQKVEEDGVDKVEAMVATYKRLQLDCLVTLGGNGTHKNANLLKSAGLNIIGLPKTIDNDIYGTDMTFGFHSALDIATDVVDRIHTTADSHDRVMIIELMGNKAGWLTLYAGLAGGADVILIPELPYHINGIIKALNRRKKSGKDFSIIVVAEGALSQEEALMDKKALKTIQSLDAYGHVSYRLANAITQETGFETRVTIPGHQQRGGSPSAYDRVLSTTLGAFAAELIAKEAYGNTISVVNNQLKATPLEAVAGRLKLVPEDEKLITTAQLIGVSFGTEG